MRRRRPGDRARRRSGGPHGPCGEAGGCLRPQGVDAPGRRGSAADGDRLLERRNCPLRRRARRPDTAEPGHLVARERVGAVMVSHEEVERRYRLVREAMAEHHLDAVLVCGSEYSGFEGAVTYLSGFVVVHRYAYVLLPREGDPTIIFPTEARYVGEHGTSWIEDQVFVDRPGEYIGDRLAAQRVGVYGLDYAMTVRDFEGTHLRVEIVPFYLQFDLARAGKN